MSHEMVCPTCNKTLDMRDLSSAFCHGFPDPDKPGSFKCMSDEEIEGMKLPDVASRRIGEPVMYDNDKNSIHLN